MTIKETLITLQLLTVGFLQSNVMANEIRGVRMDTTTYDLVITYQNLQSFFDNRLNHNLWHSFLKISKYVDTCKKKTLERNVLLYLNKPA